VSILLKNYACQRLDSTGMRGAAREDLLFPAARPIDGEALASELVGEEKGCGHLGLSAMAGKLMVFETPLSLYIPAAADWLFVWEKMVRLAS
jgi:hypothetical protein